VMSTLVPSVQGREAESGRPGSGDKRRRRDQAAAV